MRMTIAELKTKIHTEFEIPTNVQRWIIGKNLADHDEATLDELHAVDGSPVFLYLVAPGNSIHTFRILLKQKPGFLRKYRNVIKNRNVFFIKYNKKM